MSGSTPAYVPGACNIAGREVSQRRALGWVGLVATLGLWAALFASHAPLAWRLTLAVPATVSALGFLQSGRRFCAAYGLMGRYNLGSDGGGPESVSDHESRRRDRRTSLGIVGLGALIGLGAGALAYLVELGVGSWSN